MAKKYDPFSLTELIRNDEFITWVLHPDSKSDLQWAAFLEQYPEKKKTVESARAYIILLAEDTGRSRPSQAQTDRMWKAVESGMSEKKTE
ncbi:hypothetical protein DYBT9275_00641 [Dyadobacter sp. CECT 9275]|uniref:Uncharacterized protein n=1 Tax=Dyadobacter helix TaxID=2822344 RepID=A0A916JAG6_9BACT|nr:hypothetical protein [Dyadobacter sp. CECT 9275]CAG4990925.1 hypothetical protein DYBT9275_00641 [Dyadobacter sp. CECT 9275]